jgi:hypothetical protein
MRRIIFCPNESLLPEAEILAKENNLLINIGLFEEIENLSFNQSKTQILEVPENNNLSYFQTCANHFHTNIWYENDFITLKNQIVLNIDNVEFQPVLAEKHKVHFLILEKTTGNKKCSIISNNKILESFNYDVC